MAAFAKSWRAGAGHGKADDEICIGGGDFFAERLFLRHRWFRDVIGAGLLA
jgi:hypothetical protein